MLAYFQVSYASLLPSQYVSSGIPTKVKYQVLPLSQGWGGGGCVGGWMIGWMGWWGKVEIKAQLSPAVAKAEDPEECFEK